MSTLLPDFLRRLSANALRCDLFITTNSAAAAADATKLLSKYKSGTTRVFEVPNRGRDIGAFLTGVANAVQGYDVIGHVHGKKSLALAQDGIPAGKLVARFPVDQPDRDGEVSRWPIGSSANSTAIPRLA